MQGLSIFSVVLHREHWMDGGHTEHTALQLSAALSVPAAILVHPSFFLAPAVIHV